MTYSVPPPPRPEKMPEYDYIYFWKSFPLEKVNSRKGQPCRILKTIGIRVKIQFKDGSIWNVNQMAIRRKS